jgi:hypothetical protein
MPASSSFRSLSVTADTYTHVLTDEREVRYEALLAPLKRA